MNRIARILTWLACAGLACFTVPAPAQTHAEAPNTDVSAAFTTDTDRLFVGQRFTLTLAIQSRGVNLGSEFQLAGLSDAGVIELGAAQELPAERQAVDGRAHEQRRFRWLALARQPGDVTLAPGLQYTELHQERTWFGVSTFQSPRHIGVAPLSLTVLPLPEAGRPPDFSGAVGQFTFTLEPTPRRAAPGDLVTLVLTLRGDGSLDHVPCPELVDAAPFRVYPPQARPDAPPGTRVFEQTVIPTDAGIVATPAARFSYFDPQAAAYRTLTAGPVPLEIHARTAAPAFTPYRPDAPPDAATGGTPPPGAAGEAASSGTGERAWARLADPQTLPVVIRLFAWASLVGGGIALGRGLFRPRRQSAPARRRLSAVGAILLGVAGLGVARGLAAQAARRVPDATTAHAVNARLAPSERSRTLFDLPAGSSVTVSESWHDWRRIAWQDRQGWIPADALIP